METKYQTIMNLFKRKGKIEQPKKSLVDIVADGECPDSVLENVSYGSTEGLFFKSKEKYKEFVKDSHRPSKIEEVYDITQMTEKGKIRKLSFDIDENSCGGLHYSSHIEANEETGRANISVDGSFILGNHACSLNGSYGFRNGKLFMRCSLDKKELPILTTSLKYVLENEFSQEECKKYFGEYIEFTNLTHEEKRLRNFEISDRVRDEYEQKISSK
jgi:hypothetical protein